MEIEVSASNVSGQDVPASNSPCETGEGGFDDMGVDRPAGDEGWTETRREVLTGKIAARLALRGLTTDCSGFVELSARAHGLPDWWTSNGNVLLTTPDMRIPAISCHPLIDPPKNAVVVLYPGSHVGHLMLWGRDSVVVLHRNCDLPEGHISCGGPAMVLLEANISSAERAFLDARNGGLIHVGRDGLWSNSVRMVTDDMHAIRDLTTGKRINPRGGDVIVGEHVWLGYEAMLIRGAHIGAHSIIGARSVINGRIEENSIAVGQPARVVRGNVTWSRDDDA